MAKKEEIKINIIYEVKEQIKEVFHGIVFFLVDSFLVNVKTFKHDTLEIINNIKVVDFHFRI